jgi:hypothetical protein
VLEWSEAAGNDDRASATREWDTGMPRVDRARIAKQRWTVWTVYAAAGRCETAFLAFS